MNNHTVKLWKCLLALVVSSWLLGVQAEDTLHFLALGDTGSGAAQQKQVAEALATYADKCAATNPVNFVLLLGDNFYESGVKTVTDAQWQDKFEKMYDPKRLPMPFVVALGNHDWRDDVPDTEIDYAGANPGGRWQMDAHYFKREYPADSASPDAAPLADFFIIDTEAWNTNSPHVAKYANQNLGAEQFAWLEKELSESRARWKFVTAHHPLYSDAGHGHDKQLLDLRARLGPLFKRWKVDAFITGHDHVLERIEVPGEPTLFLVSGAGGKLGARKFHDYGPFFAAEPGFLAIKLTEKEIRGEFLDGNGKILGAWHRAPLSAAP